MDIRKFLALLLAVSLLMLPACSGEERSKSVEEAETYDDLTMDFDDDDYDEGTMLEQSYLDAIHHWEKNQPWPEPKK